MHVERISRYQLKHNGKTFALLSSGQFTKFVETIKALDVQKLHADGEKSIHELDEYPTPVVTDLGAAASGGGKLLHVVHDEWFGDEHGVTVRVTDSGSEATGLSVNVALADWPDFVAGLDNVSDMA